MTRADRIAAALERLREGLAKMPMDEGWWSDRTITLCCNLDEKSPGSPLISGIANWSPVRVMACEIQRHRALVGGGK